MPSSALRQEFRASLDCELETATTLGLDHIGLPISSDAIASLSAWQAPWGGRDSGCQSYGAAPAGLVWCSHAGKRNRCSR